MVLAAGNVTDGARIVALALDEPASIEREITGYVETTIDEDTLTLQMQPHSFTLLWLR